MPGLSKKLVSRLVSLAGGLPLVVELMHQTWINCDGNLREADIPASIKDHYRKYLANLGWLERAHRLVAPICCLLATSPSGVGVSMTVLVEAVSGFLRNAVTYSQVGETIDLIRPLLHDFDWINGGSLMFRHAGFAAFIKEGPAFTRDMNECRNVWLELCKRWRDGKLPASLLRAPSSEYVFRAA